MRLEFIDGSTAIAWASLKAGCNFYAGYPISPATELHQWMMTELPQHGGIAIQGEDEIASISLCIGASMSGRKALTATSGPGMSLYSENIGLAIMAEVPLVIVNIQRLGPATGGATTGAEGDIQFMNWITSGGLPMVVLAPYSVESAYRLTGLAFNIAETLRTPVILLASKELALSRQTVESSALKMPPVKNRKYFNGKGKFIPYRYSKISAIPDFLPVGADQPVRFTTSMHDESGYITKDPKKIEKKFLHLKEKIIQHQNKIHSFTYDPQEGASNLFIAYGLNAPVCRELTQDIRAQGKKCSLLIIESLFPLPEDILKQAMAKAKKIILPELNLGLYRESLKGFLRPGQEIISVTRFNGELLSKEDIIREAKVIL